MGHDQIIDRDGPDIEPPAQFPRFRLVSEDGDGEPERDRDSRYRRTTSVHVAGGAEH